MAANVLTPAACPIHGTRLQDEPGYAAGLVRRRCPEPGCVYVTPSRKPAKPRKARRAGDLRPATGTRTRETGGDLGTWGGDSYWRDPDERAG